MTDGLIYKYSVSRSPVNRVSPQAAKAVTLGEELTKGEAEYANEKEG